MAAGDSSSSWWNSWLDSAKETSLAALNATKRDLSEFITVLKTDTEAAVTEATTSLKGLLNGDDDKSEEHEDNTVDFRSSGTSTVAVATSRYEAQLHNIECSPQTYTQPPGEKFTKWAESFVIQDQTDSISVLLLSKPHLQEIHTRLVPSVVSYNDFWSRYFYHVYCLKEENERRASLVARATETSTEELSWDDDENDPTEGNPTLNTINEEVEPQVMERNHSSREDEDQLIVPGGMVKEEKRDASVPGGAVNKEKRDASVPRGAVNEEKRDASVPGGLVKEEKCDESVPGGMVKEEKCDESVPGGMVNKEKHDESVPKVMVKEEKHDESVPGVIVIEEQDGSIPRETKKEQHNTPTPVTPVTPVGSLIKDPNSAGPDQEMYREDPDKTLCSTDLPTTANKTSAVGTTLETTAHNHSRRRPSLPSSGDTKSDVAHSDSSDSFVCIPGDQSPTPLQHLPVNESWQTISTNVSEGWEVLQGSTHASSSDLVSVPGSETTRSSVRENRGSSTSEEDPGLLMEQFVKEIEQECNLEEKDEEEGCLGNDWEDWDD